jgi:hypothetical protein
MVTDPPGPGATVAGNAPAEIQLSAALTELIVSVPPPVFTMPSAVAVDWGLVADALNESKGEPMLS